MNPPRKILYCTTVPISTDGGGNLVCREHIRMLSGVPNSELHVFSPKVDEALEGIAFFESLGVTWHKFSFLGRRGRFVDRLFAHLPFRFSFESIGVHNRHIDLQFRGVVDSVDPDVIVIDYLFSVLVMPSCLRSGRATILISLNREAEFYREQRAIGKLSAGCSNSLLAEWRLSRFERRTYARASHVVVLTPNDLEVMPPSARDRATVIRPVLPRGEQRWSDHGEKSLFFVGSVNHYPNLEAVEWLATRLAPNLEKAAPDCRIKVIGASEDQVPQGWLRPNIDYMGRSTREEVRRLFLECGMFIAPIRNNFGSKIKILEAMSFGTPTIATEFALSGLENTSPIEMMKLEDPEGCASRIVSLMADPACRKRMSEAMEVAHRKQMEETERMWSRLVAMSTEMPVRRKGRNRCVWLERCHRWMCRQKKRWKNGRTPALPPSDAGALPQSKSAGKSIDVLADEIPGILFNGWFDVESYKGQSLRWSAPESTITIRWPHASWPRSGSFRIWPIVPQGGRAFRVYVNGVEVYSGAVNRGALKASFPIPRSGDSDLIDIRVVTTAVPFEGDSRDLGLAFNYLRLHR